MHIIRGLRIDTLPAMRTARTAIPSGDAFPLRSSVLSHRWDRLGMLLRDSQTLRLLRSAVRALRFRWVRQLHVRGQELARIVWFHARVKLHADTLHRGMRLRPDLER